MLLLPHEQSGGNIDLRAKAFIARSEHSGAAERANYALFLSEVCDSLGVPHPDPEGWHGCVR